MRLLAVLAATCSLTGCVTSTVNLANPTATESLLRAHAAERACAELNLHIAVGTPTFVQVTAGAGLPGGEITAAACRAHLAGRGAALVSDPKAADETVELRISAASIVFGICAYNRRLIDDNPLEGRIRISHQPPHPNGCRGNQRHRPRRPYGEDQVGHRPCLGGDAAQGRLDPNSVQFWTGT